MLTRNALMNLAGHAAPLVAAIALVPLLVRQLDVDRFGFLSIAWVLVGYFSLFDLGLGRALTRLVAEMRDGPRREELPRLARTALTLTGLLGVAGTMALFLSADFLCARVIVVPAELQAEAAAGLRVLALCLPLVTVTAALRGMLEGIERFDWVNAIRIPLGVLTFMAPLAAASVAIDMVYLSISLAAVRLIGFVSHWVVCARLLPGLSLPGRPVRDAAREMLGYGAWLTASNLVGPLILYLDRLILGATASIAAVAYYAAPFEAVTRLAIIPAALTGVLFPAFASAKASSLEALYRKGIAGVAAMIVPAAALLGWMAPVWMSHWLGTEYSAQSSGVVRWLCLGVAVNGLAYLPYTLLQARGRSDLVAKLYLAELPFYVVTLWVMCSAYGSVGAAVTWAMRCGVDAVALFVAARSVLREPETVHAK